MSCYAMPSAGKKKYRTRNDMFRNKLRKYDKVLDIVSGLINYRIMNIV